jgi:hypothetical protein
MDAILKNPYVIVIGVICMLTIAVIVAISLTKSSFKATLFTSPDQLNKGQPMQFAPLDEQEQEINLLSPEVPEEIGLAMAYPQGSGVGMDANDSNSFYPTKPGSLLASHSTPESYGESSLADPYGGFGSEEGSRILKLNNAGIQSQFQPVDEIIKTVYAQAYDKGEVSTVDSAFINGGVEVKYNQDFVPESNLYLQSAPGQKSSRPNCETTYPNVVKYNGMCITQGDIPYGQVVDGKVNPRLVSRWESFTGDYSRQQALEPIDGLLYPTLNVLT